MIVFYKSLMKTKLQHSLCVSELYQNRLCFHPEKTVAVLQILRKLNWIPNSQFIFKYKNIYCYIFEIGFGSIG